MKNFMSTRRKHLLLPIAIVLTIAVSVLNFPQHAQAQDGQSLNWDEPVLGQVTTPEGTLFNFQANAGETINIEVLGIGGLEPTIVLQDANRTIVAQEANNAGENTVALNYTVFTSGFYYVQVNGRNNTVGQFTILLSRGLPPGIPLQVTTPTDGAVSPTLPSVYYDFTTNPDTITRLTIRSLSEGYSPTATVMNSNGDMVAAVIGEALVGATLEFGPGNETYKIQVELGTFTEQANFQVVLNYGPEEPPEPQSDQPPSSDSQPSGSDSSSSSSSSSTCVLTSQDGNDIRIRAGGSTNHAIIGVMPGGTSLNATGYNQANGGWYEVQMNNGAYGWMASFVVVATGDTCTSLPFKTYAPAGSGGPSETEEPSGGSTTATVTTTPTYTSTSSGPDETQEVVGPTATYTPSYTPTTPPADQIAPNDPRFLDPLNIPLDNTSSRLDFVSYPNGDTEDRIRWDIQGMNPNSALSGGRARLVIQATCFGEGTQYITFFTGGQTYGCGDTIVDRDVTYDSRTGQVTITATGGQGTYVQWVLTGTATRTN